jgi:TM2 domain-containing membrane protein YozV
MEIDMSNAFCTACGNSMSAQAAACPGCGHPNAANSRPTGAVSGAPKSRVTAGILALLVGGLGIHKFYLNQAGLGIVYLLFCWTFIPAIVAFIEAIVYFTQTDQAFATAQKVNVI